MGNWQSVFSTVSWLAVTFFVPAVVWITVSLGLYQLIRDKVRRVRVVSRRSDRFARESLR